MGAEGPKLWGSWTDPLGQEYKPGDYVAFARGNGGGGASLAFGKVKRINRINSKGELITAVDYSTTRPYQTAPSCTVTVIPLSGGYYGKEGSLKTLLNPHNIVKVSSRPFRNKSRTLEKALRDMEADLS